MSEVIVDGVRYLPMKRKTTRNRRPLSQLLADARIVSHQSLAQVARMTKITKTHLWELERGYTSNPTLSILQRLLSYYGIHYDEIAEVKP